jgi:hypothetical protein
MIEVPTLWLKVGALIMAQEVAQDIGGVLAEVAAPGTVLGAMVLGERYMSRARREAIAMSQGTADQALARAAEVEIRLARERLAWEEREAELKEEIVELRRRIIELKSSPITKDNQ